MTLNTWRFPATPSKIKVAVLAASSNTAYPATMTVMLNGTQVKPVGYNIQGNNYYKLRDVAQILTDTTAQFNVSWDKHSRTMNLLTGSAYRACRRRAGCHSHRECNRNAVR